VATSIVLYVMLGLPIFVALSLAALRLWFAPKLELSRNVPPQTFPAPRIEGDTPEALQRLFRDQRARLEGYAWADKQNGVVRIPIDRAMELIAARGKKGYEPLEASAGPAAPNGKPDQGATP
jgi:hypothetical protein